MTTTAQVSNSNHWSVPFTVAVEGNIGSGKSTFLSYCETDGDVEVFHEPVEQWTNVAGVNLLDKYYTNPEKWGLTFQLQVNASLLNQYQKRSTRPIKMVERSLLSAKNCFQRIMLARGTLEPVMGTVMDQWHELTVGRGVGRPSAIVYLRTSPIVAYDRMRTRARGEETSVSLDYLTELHWLHEEWLEREQQLNLADEEDMPVSVVILRSHKT